MSDEANHFWETEIAPLLTGGVPVAEAIWQLVKAARRERDVALEMLDSHHEFWKRSQAELEDAKTRADQAHNRAKRLQAKDRRGKHRRQDDEANAAIRAQLEKAIRLFSTGEGDLDQINLHTAVRTVLKKIYSAGDLGP